MEKKYCPFLKRSCLKEECELYTGKGDYKKCAFRAISDDIGYKMYELLKLVKKMAGGNDGG